MPLTLHILNRRVAVVNSFFAFFCKFYTFSCLCYLLYNLYVFSMRCRCLGAYCKADALKRVLSAVAVAPRVFGWFVRLRRFLGHLTALYGHCIAVARLRRLYTRADGGGTGMWERAQRGGGTPSYNSNLIFRSNCSYTAGRGGSWRQTIRVTIWIIY